MKILILIAVCLLIGYVFGVWVEKGIPPDNHTNTRDDLPEGDKD